MKNNSEDHRIKLLNICSEYESYAIKKLTANIKGFLNN